jgi:transposase InsO family protein
MPNCGPAAAGFRASEWNGFCERALIMAIQRRQPPRGLICHSDRPSRSLPANCCQATGVQYASGPYRRILERHGIQQSMSRKGNCLDHAPMESFFGTLENEWVHRCRFATHDDARRSIFRWIEAHYNRRRRHSSIADLTPAHAYTQMAMAA